MPSKAKPEIDIHGVRVSNPDRELFPGIRKRDLIDYYEMVAEAMLPHIARRPLTLRRYPRGVGAPGFFQQHHTDGLPAGFGAFDIREAEGEVEPHVYIENLAGLVGAAQMSILELHGWGSRIDDLEKPDRLVFDLDPDPSVGFAEVVDAAFDIRARLGALESWPMLSGGKGVHVIVPLKPKAEWGAVKAFASAFAEALANERPERYLDEASKAERKGRIFIDWLRNQRGQTAVMPFSTRAKPRATVAMPVGWDELRELEGADAYTVRRVLDQGFALPKGWGGKPQTLPQPV